MQEIKIQLELFKKEGSFCCSPLQFKVWKIHKETFFNERDLLVQLKSALIMSYAWHKLLKIKPGQGRVWNVDESMTYLRQRKSQTYSM